MSEYLKLKKSNCKNCYKCIRHCPVKSIRFSDNQAHIVTDECILCGRCFVACPQNAKEIRNDVAVVRAMIDSGAPVYASVAPSFVANYEGATIETMERALRALGFAAAEETAVGATIVKNRYDEMVNHAEQDVIISTCCHTVNIGVQKHFPEALPFLAPVLSPMLAHGAEIKKEHPEAKTVFLSPCISKKQEAELYPGMVDCVLTFEELTGWMRDEGIEVEPALNGGGDRGRARAFPVCGGIIHAMKCENPDYTYLAIDGLDNVAQALRDVIAGNLTKCFIEMSACAGSCIGGPAMDKDRRAPVREYITVRKYAPDADFIVEPHDTAELKKSFPYIGIKTLMPGSAAIAEILHRMGKLKPEDELNCGSCGYDSCREKAIAVYNGKADLTMCLPFLKEKAETFSDNIIRNTPNGIIVLNELFEVQQINRAACELFNIENSADVLGEPVVRILDPQPFMEVMQSGKNIRNKRAYLAEYKRYVDQTIMYDPNYHIVMSIMRDVTEEETHKVNKETISRRTIEITDKVVEKQMRVVQEIASLLGETTAETKIALTKLKESLADE